MSLGMHKAVLEVQTREMKSLLAKHEKLKQNYKLITQSIKSLNAGQVDIAFMTSSKLTDEDVVMEIQNLASKMEHCANLQPK